MNSTRDTQRQRHLLSLVARAWRQDNERLFHGALTAPSFSLNTQKHQLGSWDPERRMISLSAELFEGPWFEVVEVLRHEMAHQYVSEALKCTHEPPHGPSFVSVCEARGINARATGEALSEEGKRLVERVRKLLALAESDNPHEAELAATQAHSLITRYHLEHLQSPEGGTSTQDHMRARALGTPKSRHYQYEYALTNLLTDHFMVDVIWVEGVDLTQDKIGTVAEACGRLEDLEVAEYVYHYLHNHIQLAWRAHKRAHKLKGLKHRLSFALGVVRGFHAKLKQHTEAMSEERGLMITRAQAASDYLRKRHPHIRTIGRGGWRPSQAFEAGYETGQTLNLNPGLKSTSSPRALPAPQRGPSC